MSFNAIENNPIIVDLTVYANYTGWVNNADGTATHSSCQSGNNTLDNYPVVAGHTYFITYTLISNSGGYTQTFAGSVGGTQYTTAQIIEDTITATTNDPIKIFSTASCQVGFFNIKDITISDGICVVYSMLDKTWSHFWSAQPEFGVSLFESNITSFQGGIWFQLNGSQNTNSWYGVSYQSIIKAVFAKNPAIINSYDVLSYQANQLLVSTQGGITTPLGQQTTLIDTDFIKAKLSDGTISTTVYQYDQVYSASFWNDENGDTVNGDPLRGNYLIVELTTVDGSSLLELFSLSVKSARSFIGNR